MTHSFSSAPFARLSQAVRRTIDLPPPHRARPLAALRWWDRQLVLNGTEAHADTVAVAIAVSCLQLTPRHPQGPYALTRLIARGWVGDRGRRCGVDELQFEQRLQEDGSTFLSRIHRGCTDHRAACAGSLCRLISQYRMHGEVDRGPLVVALMQLVTQSRNLASDWGTEYLALAITSIGQRGFR